MKLPEVLTQNRPKHMKLPKILPEIATPYTNPGGPVPPWPPPPPTPMGLVENDSAKKCVFLATAHEAMTSQKLFWFSADS